MNEGITLLDITVTSRITTTVKTTSHSTTTSPSTSSSTTILSTSPSTTVPATTTIDYCDDIEYNILDSESRNSGYSSDNKVNFCDRLLGNGNQSPDWSGPGWYRIEGPAGSMLPELPV